MDEFRQVFEAYGANYEITMERFLGKEELYLKYLDMLFEDDTLSKLEVSLALGDLSSAFEAAHTLKGVVGNMGLAPLYTAVCALVEPLRKKVEGDYQALLKVVQGEFCRADALRGKLKGSL